MTVNKRCRAVVIATGGACGKPATRLVTFLDDDKTWACAACALALEQTALSFKAPIKVEKLV